MIAAVAVIVMCAAGLVGAGYAYTASTVNEGNNANSEYIVLSQSGAGAYTFVNEQAVYYNTVNRSVAGEPTTTYELSGDVVPLDTNLDETNEYTAVKLGNNITLAATQTSGYHADLSCSVALSGEAINIPTGYVLILKADTDKPAADDQYLVYSGTWSPASFTIYANENTAYYGTTIQIYLGYAVGSHPTTAPDAALLTDATLTFNAARALDNHFIVDFTAQAVDGAKLDSVTYKVYDNAGTELALTTAYTAEWKTAAGVVIEHPEETEIGEDVEYVLVITGAGAHAGKVTEFWITGIAA